MPEDWSKSLIVKIHKKGDIKNCNNWCSITLLSIQARCSAKSSSTGLRQPMTPGQAGFRKGRGCMDQTFALQNIIEQCLEWNTSLYINFVDFKKAFDSVHRNTLWKTVHSYGIPPKFIRIIKSFYEHFECSVIMGSTPLEWFPVQSGVRQGSVISPILFLVAIDWIKPTPQQTDPEASSGPHPRSWKILTLLTISLSYQPTTTTCRLKVTGSTTLLHRLDSALTPPKLRRCV